VLFLRNVTFMTTDPIRLADFWSAALGLAERVEHGGEIVLADADWRYPRLTFQPVDEVDSRASRVHVDLTADDRSAEVERLRQLGATVVRDVAMDDGWTWTVLADPDGNELCVTDP
jgi:catechol 2,3-dioxygenase-like lactoylglutathione lyase family enzyme